MRPSFILAMVVVTLSPCAWAQQEGTVEDVEPHDGDAAQGVQGAAPDRDPAPWGAAPPLSPSPAGVPAQEEGRTLVAVLFLATRSVDVTLADNLTEVLVASVASAGRYTIVGREQFGEALGFGGEEETLECAEDAVCLGRIATLVGAEEVVLGLLGERAGRYIVNLSRIDVAEARAVHRVFRVLEAELGPLIGAVRQGADELMQPPPGAATVSVDVPDATIFIDGEEAVPDPDGVIRGLAPGEHELLVGADGYEDLRRSFDVDRGGLFELAVSLSRVETVVEAPPWHTRWWVWTLVGVAVAGAGAATAAILLRPESQPDVTGTLGTVRFPLGGTP